MAEEVIMGSTEEEEEAGSSSSCTMDKYEGLTLKEGERIVAPTRRPDGTLRKPIRIRAGYVPQEEVAIYQSKGALLRRGMPEVPPGYDPLLESKPKTKSAKRNERRKEKKQQASLASSTSEKDQASENTVNGQAPAAENRDNRDPDVEAISQQMGLLTVTTDFSVSTSSEQANPDRIDLDKRIRALKKKIRLTESQQASTGEATLNPEQREKLAKLDMWRKELKDLEEKRMALRS